jgi:hypothetical protein
MTAPRKFRISLELDEETVRCLGVVKKEQRMKPADAIRRALNLFFSRPIQGVGKTRGSR